MTQPGVTLVRLALRTGALVATEGLSIVDWIQSKDVGAPGEPVNIYQVFSFNPDLTNFPIPSFETVSTTYTLDAGPLDNKVIRNEADITITNHSGHLGIPFGPNPRFSYDGLLPPPPCEVNKGCTYTQGFWKNHTTAWPANFDPNATFFLSHESWIQVLKKSPKGSPGYFQLAHQYIAAVLNMAKATDPAQAPQSVQDILKSAEAWLAANTPTDCAGPSSCGDQKNWAAILDTFNNGL